MANLTPTTARRTAATVRHAALLVAMLTATSVTADPEPSTSTTVIGGNEMLQAGADALRNGDFQRGIELTVDGLRRPNAQRDVAAALSNLCAGFVGLRQYDTALEKCNEALKIDETNWRTWNNRAAAYLGKGMYDAALRDVESGLKQAPQSATLKKTRQIVLERQRSREELKRDALKTWVQRFERKAHDPTPFQLVGRAGAHPGADHRHSCRDRRPTPRSARANTRTAARRVAA